MMVFGGGTLGKGTNVLVKVTPQRSLTLPMGGHSQKIEPCVNQEALIRHRICWGLDLGLPTLEQREMNVCFWKAPQSLLP